MKHLFDLFFPVLEQYFLLTKPMFVQPKTPQHVSFDIFPNLGEGAKMSGALHIVLFPLALSNLVCAPYVLLCMSLNVALLF